MDGYSIEKKGDINLRAHIEKLLLVQLNKQEVIILNDLLKHLSEKNLNDDEDMLVSDIVDEFDGFLENI